MTMYDPLLIPFFIKSDRRAIRWVHFVENRQDIVSEETVRTGFMSVWTVIAGSGFWNCLKF